VPADDLIDMVIDDPEEPAPALALGAEPRGVDRRA